jgi:hypothetical protein
VTKEYPKETDVVREANERLELASLPPVPPGYVAPAPAKAAPAPIEKVKPAEKKPAAKPAPPAKKKKK